jgi:hypothetical protein
MRFRHLGLALVAVTLSLSTVPLHAKELTPVTGRQWTTATEQEKKAFLYGLGTMIQLEHELARQQNAPADRPSLVPTFIRGLERTNLVGVLRFVDDFFARNPARLDRPVVDVIWRDLVLPEVQQAQAGQER